MLDELGGGARAELAGGTSRQVHARTAHVGARTVPQRARQGRRGTRCRDDALVLQAAMAEEGIALDWWHIVDGLLEKRLLEPVLATTWVSGARLWLVRNDGAELSLSAVRVRNWVIAEAKRGEGARSAIVGEIA